jgi:hypothetical protein
MELMIGRLPTHEKTNFCKDMRTKNLFLMGFTVYLRKAKVGRELETSKILLVQEKVSELLI